MCPEYHSERYLHGNHAKYMRSEVRESFSASHDLRDMITELSQITAKAIPYILATS